MEPAISNKDSAASETGSASRPAAATPDEMDIDQEPTRPSTSHSASATPSEAAPSGSTSDLAGPSKSSGPKVRLRLSRSNKLPPTPVMDEDEEDEVEEEEEDEIDNEGEDSDAESESASASVSVPGTSKPSAPMTARQAALAGVSNGEARLLSLDEVDLGRKKAPAKTEEELADKRREAAKRRKQQLEQKTKEEKEGAVDRLLNKQAPRPRAKRNLSGVLSGTPTGYSTPVRSSLRTTEIIDPDTRSTSPDGDGSLNEDTIVRAPVLATSIRWISTSRGPDAGRPLVEEIGTPDPQDESSASTNPPSEAAERRNTTSFPPRVLRHCYWGLAPPP
ncbi:hypothetical protein FRB99_007351 [Tulasnella sp. 403]|nr:hypothetical protein FRB99_007351 [Tulasnella sp. 403]